MDYGNSEVVTSSHIKVLESEFLALPLQATECKLRCLSQSDTDIWNDNSIGTFTDLLLKNSVSVKFMEQVGSVWEVDIFFEGKSVTAQLCNTIMTSFHPESEEEPTVSTSVPALHLPPLELSSEITYQHQLSRLEPSEFAHVQFNTGQIIESVVSYVESPSSFWIQLLSADDDLFELSDKLSASRSRSNDFPSSLSVGSICCAKYSEDEKWHRGMVKSVLCERFEVFFFC